MTTDTSEAGLERLICRALTGSPCEPGRSGSHIAEQREPYGGAGYFCGDPADYDREYCVDLFQLTVFLKDSQPEIAAELDLGNDSPTRRKFLARLQGKISKRGVVEVLCHGIKHGPYNITLF